MASEILRISSVPVSLAMTQLMSQKAVASAIKEIPITSTNGNFMLWIKSIQVLRGCVDIQCFWMSCITEFEDYTEVRVDGQEIAANPSLHAELAGEPGGAAVAREKAQLLPQFGG